MNTPYNRRQNTRHTAVCSVKYTVKEGTFRDLINNISAGGVFIRTRRKIDQGRTINLQFPFFAFKKRLNVMGTVVRSNSNGFAVVFDDPMDENDFS